MVRGRSHLNVSAVMKKTPIDVPIKMILLRNDSNMEKVAVKKFTQFPVKLDDVVSTTQFHRKKWESELKLKLVPFFTDF